MRNCDFYKTKEEAYKAYEKLLDKMSPYMEFDVWQFQEHISKQDELIYHSPIFDVIKASEVQPNFRPIKIKSNDWICVVVEKDGQFLMEKQFRYGLGIEEIEFPCGIIEDNETPLNAAQREVKEETGLDIPIKEFHSLGKYAANPGFMTNYMHYFYVNLDNVEYNVGSTNFDKHEQITTFWKNKYEAQTMLINNGDTSIFMIGVFLKLHLNHYFQFNK